MRIIIYISCLILGMIVLSSCEEEPVNPFDPYNNIKIDTVEVINYEPASIEGLYHNIFKPTCANSGCHDGTFEPEFRTIEGTYNSLVFHPIIKNDASDPIDYRVLPGNHNESMFYRRLTVNLGGNSGTMPLAIDPDSDWNDKKDQYIQNVKDWINSGAKDLMGNPATTVNREPQMAGIVGRTPGGIVFYDRSEKGSIIVPSGQSIIDVYFSLNDLESPAQDLSIGKLYLSKSRDDFSNAWEFNITFLSNPVQAEGYSGIQVDYHFKSSVSDPGNFWKADDVLFAKIEVKDPDHTDFTEVPGRYSADHIKLYFSLEL